METVYSMTQITHALMYNTLQHLILTVTLNHLLTTSGNIMVTLVTEYTDLRIICVLPTCQILQNSHHLDNHHQSLLLLPAK